MNNATDQVITQIQEAIHAASQEYFVWSDGAILYDCGVELLMQVYSAQRLFDAFKESEDKVILHLERRCRDLLPSLRGRVDLTIELGTREFYIEFKRYSNPAQMAPDLARLSELAAARNAVGLFAAPCYMKESEGAGWDWPLRDKTRHAEESSQLWHLSDARQLPKPHRDGWTHERVLVIQVPRQLLV